MSEMKYLMLFEAFESNALSKMMGFLKSKIDNNSKERFRDRLKTMISQLDIPIDKIKDDNVKYLNRSQALKLRATEENESDLYCLKFWFSMEEGYLGFTGTGEYTMNFNEYLKGGRRRRSEGKNEPFNQEELNYIKNTLDIKTGKLKPVKDYEELQHGQLVIGMFSSDDDEMSKIGLAKIWRDEYGRINAIQNVSGGGSPDYDVNGVNWRDWGTDPRFTHSWSMDSVSSPADDHHKLHFYTPSDEPLHIEGKKEEEKKETTSPFDFNLPVNRYYNLSEWGQSSWSIDNYKVIENSDFAIVLMISDIIKSVETKVTDVRKSRIESKEGATKLMNNLEIREANIKRYLLALISKMGITTDISNLQNLQKLVLKSVCGDFAFIALYKGRPDFDHLNTIVKSIYNIMRIDDESDKKYYLDNAIQYYQYLNSSTEDYKKEYAKSLEIIKNSDNENIKEFFNILMGISKKIVEYLLSQNIQSIEDLQMVIAKLKSIGNISNDYMFRFESVVSSIIGEFQDSSDVKYYISNYADRDISKEITKAKHLERYVDSLLR
jgi:hypothetical protein